MAAVGIPAVLALVVPAVRPCCSEFSRDFLPVPPLPPTDWIASTSPVAALADWIASTSFLRVPLLPPTDWIASTSILGSSLAPLIGN